jgi:hypothetical protein
MKILLRLIYRAGDIVDVQPVLALFLGGALLAVFVSTLFQMKNSTSANSSAAGLLWTLYHHATRLLWASMLVALVVASLSLLRGYIRQTLADFQHNHGRVTSANYGAVQTIWGPEQVQGGLHVELFWEEEVTERIEFEDLSKPAVMRKKTVRHDITGNPFVSESHQVSLRQNARKKGSALYGGYETDCHFLWHLKSPADREVKCVLKFPLPAATAMYDNLIATLDGDDILPSVQLSGGAMVLTRTVTPGEELDLAVSFKSRGMSSWYFQVREAREIRSFNLVMTLPDQPKARLNYPEGCMTPTQITNTTDRQGSILNYRLDHALSNKGMGIALPTIPQPGASTTSILCEVERGWLFTYSMLILGLVLAGLRHSVLLGILFGAASACAYGLAGNFADLIPDFPGSAILILAPAFLFLAWLLTRSSAVSCRLLAGQMLLFCLFYPVLAGLDSDRQALYFDICAIVFIASAAWQLVQRLGRAETLATAPA